MRLANVAGRAGLVVDDGIVDVAVASRGALPSDPQLLYERWDDVRALAERVTKAAAPLDVGGSRRRCRSPARCSPSA